jgi:filamentous hemagglutinin family protein
MISMLRRKSIHRAQAALLIVLFAIDAMWRAEAGDILRGGATGGSPGRASTNSSGVGSLAPPRATAQDALARTSQAVQAVRAMQDAARNAALNGPHNLGVNPFRAGQQLPNVPNGLVPGGLQVAPGVPRDLGAPAPGENPLLWQGANLPQESNGNGQTTVTITQTAQQAILNWETFNIGMQTRLTFDQTAGGANASQWIAFNTIRDPSGNPSQILGSLDAIGQVYIINQNGILFGGSSQVNLHTLVASALPSSAAFR